MKSIITYINEKLIISKTSFKRKYNYFPNDLKELNEIVEKLIKERGKKADLNDIDVSKITRLDCLFQETIFNGDISEWNVSNVESATLMFHKSTFDGDLSNWDVRKLENAGGMFAESDFSDKDEGLKNWQPIKLNKISQMFMNCYNFKTNLDNWLLPKEIEYKNATFVGSGLDGNEPKWFKNK
jgi:hypothetical protein